MRRTPPQAKKNLRIRTEKEMMTARLPGLLKNHLLDPRELLQVVPDVKIHPKHLQHLMSRKLK